MRYQQCRLLLLRSYRRSHLPYRSPFPQSQITSISTRSFSSFLHTRSELISSLRSQSTNLMKSLTRTFSSEPETKPESTVIDIFTRLSDEDEIRKELESSNIEISQDLALKILRILESNPNLAKRFFQLLSEEEKLLTSKNYNMMLRILGGNGFIDEFWCMVDVMKKKGHGLSANVRDKVGEKFLKDGHESDSEKLKKLFVTDTERVCNRVCKIVLKEEWNDDVEKRIRDLSLVFDTDLVKMIVESLDVEPRKALLFFRWIDESNLFKHDEKTYNAVARVLGREKYLDRFQNVVEEMRISGYEVELETYVTVSTKFCQSRLIEEAVDLFETAMECQSSSGNKPTPQCLCLLLKKIVTAKVFDIDLFSRAVKAYRSSGDRFTDSMLKSVLKSLTSVDRVGEINEVLKAMKEGGGYTPSSDLQSMIASELSRKGKKEVADELELDDKAITALVEGYCNTGELEEALKCYEKMVVKENTALEKLVVTYCNKNQVRDAYKLLMNAQVKPLNSTYEIVVKKLLTKKNVVEGGFEQALCLLPSMKDHGFPPLVEPFLKYFSKSGESVEALSFLKALNSKSFASNAMVLHLFESMLKSGRHSEAQDLLSMCPNHIRNHPDVLELFNSMKLNEGAVEEHMAASA